jgi:hypothetical protein
MSSITNNISSDDISRMLHGHTHFVIYVVQLADGRLVSAGDDHKLKIWNIMSLSQQKWIRRRLLVLLFEASKILSKPPESALIRQEQYLRLSDLELLLRCALSMNISNDMIYLKTFKITLMLLSNRVIVQTTIALFL